ncbi:hypothetical protein FRB94_002933 [Tulasnella sp. JGI-2019a]|nr:hypothetical protein FRB93_013139 [Tulasnella sp. JGI-2019a]KAG9013405.1 hypothetical protein FRB94_002933 [Tulasnella sp. JGI-2019a]
MSSTTIFARLHDYCRAKAIPFAWTDVATGDQTHPAWTSTITIQPPGAVEAQWVTGPLAPQKKLARSLAAKAAIVALGLPDYLISPPITSA